LYPHVAQTPALLCLQFLDLARLLAAKLAGLRGIQRLPRPWGLKAALAFGHPWRHRWRVGTGDVRCRAWREASPTDDERVKAVVRGARRTLGVTARKLAAATAEKTIGMSTLTRGGLAGKRDGAILLLGFALAARRSELVALDVADIEECPEGLRVRIRKSKTDQKGAGTAIAVCRGSIACPVAAVLEWLAASGISEGPVFRSFRKGGKVTGRRLSAKSVCEIVKKHAGKLGLNAADFGVHSLRAGFLTSAAAKGASIFKMMDVSRHKSVDTLRGYVRDANAFRDHAGCRTA
jgi:integrase